MGVFGIRLAGAGYVVLNVIRGMNIIALLAVMAASSVMLVKTINTNSFFFFDAVEHVTRVVVGGFLILTELPLFKSYFSRNWPLFSPSHGFVMLGVTMLLLGNSVLAVLNKAEGSQDRLGIEFWRLVIGSGIVVIFVGAVNIVASYVFRNTKQGLTARHVRSNGATASHKLEVESSIAANTPKQSRRSRYKSLFLPHKHRNSLPSYYSAGKINHNNNDGGLDRSNTNMTQRQATTPHQGFSPYGMTTASPNKGQNGFFGDMAGPGSPSSKYSADGNPSISRPDPALARHPALGGRNVF